MRSPNASSFASQWNIGFTFSIYNFSLGFSTHNSTHRHYFFMIGHLYLSIMGFQKIKPVSI